ncbi:MAG: type II secretion system protein [Gemmataceae bacterium]
MMPTTAGPTRRPGYTLVELLMVIAIISILAALLITAVSRVRGVAKSATANTDIAQLDTVLTKFKQDFNVSPPSHVLAVTAGSNGVALPRRFRMPSRLIDQNGNPEPEYQFLKRMFPRWAPVLPSDPNWNTAQFRTQANGNDFDLSQLNNYHPDYVQLVRLTNPAANSLGGGTVGLDSNQLMVLLLGGPMALFQNTIYTNPSSPNFNALLGSNPPAPATPLGTGWAPDAPYAPAASAQTKKGPFFDFPSDRLVATEDAQSATPAILTNKLSQFVDPWGTPYAFFSASSGEAYDPRVPFPWTADPQTVNDTLTYNPEADTNAPATANPKGPNTVYAARSASKWHNAGKFQLVSAGPNKRFGPGSPILSSTVATNPPPNGAGLQLPPAGKLLYPYTPPIATTAQYFLLLWEPGQIAQHPYYSEKTRGEDDICNFNAGSNLGTSSAP